MIQHNLISKCNILEVALLNTMDSISWKNANLKSKRRVVQNARSTRFNEWLQLYIVARQLQPRSFGSGPCERVVNASQSSSWSRCARSIRRRATQLHRKAVVAIRRRPNVPLITIYNRVVKFQSALHLIRLYRLSS